MNSRYLFILIGLLIILVITGCEKEVDPSSACDLTFRGENWVPATDAQNFGCALYLEKYAYKGSYYYSFGSHCADMAANIAVCGGENLCENNSRLCNKIFEQGEHIGIVAYLED